MLTNDLCANVKKEMVPGPSQLLIGCVNLLSLGGLRVSVTTSRCMATMAFSEQMY
jgi:hypothetical protein